MSKGYTKAFASTAPVAPAVAFPHGPIGAAWDWTAMTLVLAECVPVEVCAGEPQFLGEKCRASTTHAANANLAWRWNESWLASAVIGTRERGKAGPDSWQVEHLAQTVAVFFLGGGQSASTEE